MFALKLIRVIGYPDIFKVVLSYITLVPGFCLD